MNSASSTVKRPILTATGATVPMASVPVRHDGRRRPVSEVQIAADGEPPGMYVTGADPVPAGATRSRASASTTKVARWASWSSWSRGLSEAGQSGPVRRPVHRADVLDAAIDVAGAGLLRRRRIEDLHGKRFRRGTSSACGVVGGAHALHRPRAVRTVPGARSSAWTRLNQSRRPTFRSTRPDGRHRRDGSAQ